MASSREGPMMAYINAKIRYVRGNKVLMADLTILTAAVMFGIGFLGQRAVMVHGLGPMTCNAYRFGLSTVLLVLAMPLIPPDGPVEVNDSDNDSDKAEDEEAVKYTNKSKANENIVMNQLLGSYAPYFFVAKKTVWFWGICLGILNFLGSGFQQWGISLTSASKVAFIAGFDLFLTPVFGLFISSFKTNTKPQPSTWIAVGVSLLGLFLLSGATLSDFEMGMGETLTLISTVFWTLHITYTDIATSYVDTMSMMCVQMGCVTLLSAIAALHLEPQQWLWDHLFTFWPWLVFLAVSEGLGFTLMATGQNFSPPTHAAIILSLEGVFASVASYIFLGETLDFRELCGCFLMMCSTLIAKIGCPCLSDFAGRSSGHGIGHGGEQVVELKTISASGTSSQSGGGFVGVMNAGRGLVGLGPLSNTSLKVANGASDNLSTVQQQKVPLLDDVEGSDPLSSRGDPLRGDGVGRTSPASMNGSIRDARDVRV